MIHAPSRPSFTTRVMRPSWKAISPAQRKLAILGLGEEARGLPVSRPGAAVTAGGGPRGVER